MGSRYFLEMGMLLRDRGGKLVQICFTGLVLFFPLNSVSLFSLLMSCWWFFSLAEVDLALGRAVDTFIEVPFFVH